LKRFGAPHGRKSPRIPEYVKIKKYARNMYSTNEPPNTFLHGRPCRPGRREFEFFPQDRTSCRYQIVREKRTSGKSGFDSKPFRLKPRAFDHPGVLFS